MSTTNTIKFNVGGRSFEVSRDLMEKHSETMLGKLVSEVWQADPEEPVFIDRDGDIFAHVLNYLRYGSIELPYNVPKSSFERDLDFYGLVPKEGEIKDNMFPDITASFRHDRDNAKSNLDSAQRKFEMIIFATKVFHQYTLKKKRNEEFVEIDVSKIIANNDVGKGRTLSLTEQNLFLSYLNAFFGLKMATKRYCKERNIHNPGSLMLRNGCFFTS